MLSKYLTHPVALEPGDRPSLLKRGAEHRKMRRGEFK